MDKKIIAAALRTAGHYIDIANNMLYVTAAFNKKAEIYGTPECKTMDAILNAFPGMQIQVQTSSRKNHAIPYDLMEKYICIMPDAANNIAEFERIKKMSHSYRSAYRFVAAWFEKKFSNYGKLLVVDEQTGKITWNAFEQYQVAEQEAAERAAKNNAEQTPPSVEEALRSADASTDDSKVIYMQNAG